MTRGRAFLVASVATVAALVPGAALAQCPMCRLALASPDAQGLAAAFRAGILFLLAAPFVVFAVIAAIAIRTERRRAGAAGQVARGS